MRLQLRIRKGMLITFMAALPMMFTLRTQAQKSGGEPPDGTITQGMRVQIIEDTLRKLNNNYIFPEVAKKMEAAIHKRLQQKEYDNVTSARAFASLLTAHLQEISKDKHLHIGYSYYPIPMASADNKPSPEEIARFRAFNLSTNFGLLKVERMEGNIGYMDLRGFADPDLGGDTVAATMTFLANTEALVIDLRQNNGGDPAMVQLLCSYFFAGEPVHLNDLYDRVTNSTQQYWTLPHVQGKRYVDKEVYILTSKRTFSAAEEFSYNMKNLKRATLIGETTGGGANPGGMERLNDHFGVFVPTGRAINPITHTNWEGTGVTPHIAVPADQALKTAHVTALQGALAKTKDPQVISSLTETLQTVQKELAAMQAQRPDTSKN